MKSDSAPCNLHGLGVLVTRPAHQSAGLGERIRQANGRPCLFPGIEIEPPVNNRPATARLQALEQYHTVIFVSPNAVEYALPLLPATGFPEGCLLGAVGGGTASRLTRAGHTICLMPGERYDSEGLLATPQLQEVEGKSILIVRGEGGRPLLGDTLEARGAKVAYAEVYRRARPRLDPAPLLTNWGDLVQVVTVTSQEILENLWEVFVAERQRFQATPLMVVSARIRERAETLGFRQILLAPGADDQSLLQALCGWREAQRHVR